MQKGNFEQTLKASASELERFRRALEMLALALPEGTTLRRTAALAAVAHNRAMGRDVTLSDIIEEGGSSADDISVYGVAPNRMLDNFRAPSKSSPLAVNWIATEEDPDDRRRKWLRLTPAGERVMVTLAALLRDDA